MKKLTLLFLIGSFSMLFSQRKELDAKLITWENDTVNVKLRVVTNMFWPDLLNELSLNEKLTKINATGKTEKVRATTVKSLLFTDFKNNERRFENILPGRSRLYEVIYDGKIKWYRDYYPHGYDGSVQMTDIFVNEEGKRENVGLFNSMKKKLAIITAAQPSLAPDIEQMKVDREGVLSILKKYEEL